QEKKQKEQLSDKLKSAETDLQIERDAKNFIQQKLNQEKSTNSNFQNQINQLTQDKN
ncbi:15114_t:CDS:1, partial [Racocetra persica]